MPRFDGHGNEGGVIRCTQSDQLIVRCSLFAQNGYGITIETEVPTLIRDSLASLGRV